MTPSAIYSKSGKGVQEASGKTSLLSRADRSVLSAFDGKLTVSEVAQRVGKRFDAKFQQLILQLDKDGFVREVSAGAAPARPAASSAKPAATPAATPAKAAGPDLDFTIAIPASPPPKPKAPAAAPPPVDPATKARAETERKGQEDNMARARREAEEKAQKERDRVKAEAEEKFRAETEVKLRAEAEQKAKADAEAKLKAEAEAKVKAARDAENRIKAEAEAKVKAARDAAVRMAAEATAKAEAEAQAKLEAERKAREAEERQRKEEEDRRRKEEEARRAREEAERKAREAEERRRKEEDERRAREDAERKALEEAERKAREAEERKRREEEEARARQEQDAQMRRGREEAERRAQEKADRAAGAEPAKAQEKPKQKEKAPAAGGGFDSLMADLDSFSDRDDADKKAKEEAERKEKEEKKARKAREEAEHKAKEQAEEARKEAEEKARKDERRRKEEEERRAKEEEEERARREAEERKRKARETAAAKEETAPKSDDIGVSDDDLDMDDVKADQQAVSKDSRKAAREREREAKEREREARERSREREREAKRAATGGSTPAATTHRPFRRKKSWGKPIALTLFLILIVAVGAVHVMPLSTAEYEKAASEAIGRPVKIGGARLSLYSGVQLNLEGVSVGDVRIAAVRAFPEIGSLFDDKKTFSRIELDGLSLPQQALGGALAARLRGSNFSVARLNIRQLKLPGPLPIPVLDADVAVTTDGSVGVIAVRGPDNLAAKLTPSGSGIDFEATASGFTLPFLPEVTLSTFAMKGRATGDSARIESWGGASLDGAVDGTANVRWGGTWSIDGTLTVHGINAAVFAPALLSEGKAEGTGRFSMSDPDPTSFKSRGRVEGTFSVNKGVLGSFDLSRAIQTGGRQATGRTPFTEMSGQGVLDKGSVALRNVSFGAGALNAGASADITPEGALSGRIIADIKTSSQNLRATVNIGGTVKEPQVK